MISCVPSTRKKCSKLCLELNGHVLSPNYLFEGMGVLGSGDTFIKDKK